MKTRKNEVVKTEIEIFFFFVILLNLENIFTISYNQPLIKL